MTQSHSKAPQTGPDPERDTHARRRSKSRRSLDALERHESPDTTFLDPDSTDPGPWPIVMHKAKGLRVTDADGGKYQDMTACFGVLALGHRHPSATTAIRKQASRLVHGMGDVHPSDAKIALLSTLAGLLPWSDSRIVLGLSGADAIESAIKTAMVATGRHEFVAFAGAYHGLSFGALRLTDRDHFHADFAPWSRRHVTFVPFPLEQRKDRTTGQPLTAAELDDPALGEDHLARQEDVLAQLEARLAAQTTAAVVVEPLQGRAGERCFPEGFLAKVAALCRQNGTLLIADEIFTGFGRTGRPFGCDHHGITPDIMALGKALGGGLPLSACAGSAAVMGHWKRSEGEARHTQTFLGHPLACAVARATLVTLERELPRCLDRLAAVERAFDDFIAHERRVRRPPALACEVRGLGWMRGLWFYRAPAGFAVTLARRLLAQGYLVLPSGPSGRVLSWTPPLAITAKETARFLQTVSRLLDASTDA